MLGRKLRTVLTALAIVLGVAMVSGTFVLTDSIDDAFNTIFTDVYRGTDATVTGKTAFDLGDNGSVAPPFSESVLAEVKALPDVGAGGRGRRRRRAADRRRREGDHVRRRAQSRLQHRPDAALVQQPHLVEGNWPKEGEVVIDKSTAGKKNLRIGQDIGVQARGADRDTSHLRLRQVRHGRLDRRRHARRVHAADRAGPLRQDGQARPDPGRRQGRCSAREARRRDPEDPAARHTGAHRHRAGCGGRIQHERVHLLPAEVPARVRRHRTLRRRVRDRELALDHDRPAHARVRDPANARSLATTGADVDRDRGTRDRAPRVGHGPAARSRACEGPLQAVRRRRLHPPEQRAPVPDADDRRIAARRRDRDLAREPASRDPRHAGATDRGSPRGGDASRRTLRPLPHARLGAAHRTPGSPRSSTGCSGTAWARPRCSCGWVSARC